MTWVHQLKLSAAELIRQRVDEPNSTSLISFCHTGDDPVYFPEYQSGRLEVGGGVGQEA